MKDFVYCEECVFYNVCNYQDEVAYLGCYEGEFNVEEDEE